MDPQDESPSSSTNTLSEGENSLSYYKAQYEQLEAELADFQASSRELEAELERDIEASEKRERQLQEKVESLGYEVEEWKSKSEANAAQNALQKEITSLRDTNRTITLKLRDIEVVSDDFERQARNTTSSLEDLESRYNVAIERGVMMEEEIKGGEQEREALRIETQRLRDELSDLKVEAEVRQDKLRNVEAAAERQRSRKPAQASSSLDRPSSQVSQHSETTSTSSPTIATPPTKSASSTVSETPTPPSPPISEQSVPTAPALDDKTTSNTRPTMADSNITPRPSNISARPPGSRLSISKSNHIPTSASRRSTIYRQNRPQVEPGPPRPGLPTTGSLHQIRGLIGKMQKLEQRVNSARSKLPAPTATPPKASPRSNSALGQAYIPPTITMRSNKKRTGGSNASSALQQPAEQPQRSQSRLQSRLSFGIPQPSPNRDINTVRSRPSSRHSITSRTSISHLPSAAAASNSSSRPASRQSMTGSRTPLGHYSTSMMSESRRPSSSIGGSYAPMHGAHSHSASVTRLSNHGSYHLHNGEEESSEATTPTPASRKGEQNSSIPAFSVSSIQRRMSGLGPDRRISFGTSTKGRDDRDMGPPERKLVRKLSGVGETF
ncbi:MAG: hypothetical protein Q9191_002365 [Dirinaria sp. TL-2023a]